MTIEEAIADLQARILGVSPSAVIRLERRSAEEATVRAYAPSADEEAIKAATLERTISLLTEEGLDLQVLVYDITTSLPTE